MENEFSAKRLKTRLFLILSAVITFLFIFLISVVIYMQNKRIETEDLKFRSLIDTSKKKLTDDYLNYAKKVVNQKEIKEFIINRDREGLHNFFKKEWISQKEKNPYLKIFLFHLADGTAFLRMHKPEKFGDRVDNVRPMVKAIHKDKKTILGYETGKMSTVFRIIMPIFHDNEYIGAFDIGVNPSFYINQIKQMTGTDGAVFIKQDVLTLFKRKVDFTVNGFALQGDPGDKVLNLLRAVNKLHLFDRIYRFDYLDKTYIAHTENITDYLGDIQVKLLFFNDVTLSEAIKRQTLWVFLFFSAIAILILLYFIGKQMKVFEKGLNELRTKRDQAEQALQDGEVRMSKVFDVNPNIMITTNGSDIQKVNSAMLKFTGFDSLEDFKNKHDCICDLFIESKDCINKTMDGMTWLVYVLLNPKKLHKACMLKNNQRHTFIISAKILEDNEKQRCLVNFTDITELEKVYADNTALKSLEKELRASKQQFDLFMQNIPAAITIKHNTGRIIYSNRAATSFFNRESIVGMNAYELLPEHYAEILDEMNTIAKDTGYAEEIIEFIAGDSITLFFRVMTFAIPQEDNKKVHLGTIYFDITEQYKDQHEIEKFKQVLQNSPVSIVITDTNGDIEYVNPRFTQITGYTSKEALGKNPRLLKSDYHSSDDYKQMWETISSGEVWTGIFKNINKDGEFYWETAIIVPIKNKSEKIVNYLSIKQEVTKEMSLREQLADKEEIMIAQSRHAAMGEMIGMIAHQWRQPISIIGMVANNMLLDVELKELSGEQCNIQAKNILEQTEYLSKTIDDFRNFFRPNKEKDIVCIEDVMEEAKKIIGKSLEYSYVELSIKNGNHLNVKTYSRELLQVYINLLKNAKEALLEHREKDRKIDVVISNDEKNIITTVCDNGGGISKENMEKIFEPYFSTKNEKTGTGLGLYMSKTIVDKHLEGVLTAENTDEGVCFKVSIPIKADIAE